jgi:hypothetical protein
MKRYLLVLALAIFVPESVYAKGSGGSHYSGGSHSGSHSSSESLKSNYHGRSYSTGSTAHGCYASGSHHDSTTHGKAAVGVGRDSHGPIKRSEEAKKEFMKQSGYPKGRPGYVVDHIIPLKRGGADDPSNMQWQTNEDAKAKDKWE